MILQAPGTETYFIIQISIFIALMLVYGVFLCYKALKRKERLEYGAYVAALAPFAYLWMAGFDYLGSIFILVLMWTACLGRDLWGRYGMGAWKAMKAGKKIDVDIVDSVVLYAVAAGIFFLLSAIIPAINKDLVDPLTHPDIQHWEGIFYLPVIDVNVNSAIQLNHYFTPFRIFLMADFLMMIIAMLHEIQISKTQIPAGPNIFLAVLFALPTTYIAYIWIQIPLAMLPIGLIIGVLYFVALLSYTKGKKK